MSIYLGGTCIAQHKWCLERQKNIYDLAALHTSFGEERTERLLCKTGIGNDSEILTPLGLQNQEPSPRELVEILRHCQEEDYLSVMQQALCHVSAVEIQDTVVVQAVDLHLYDAFIYEKAGAAI